MGKVLFIQTQKYAYPGLYYLCGALKEAGHEYQVIHALKLEEAASVIDEFQPDLIGYSCMTGAHKAILELSSEIKAKYPNVPIVLGGIHPTLYPDVLKHPAISFICKGDGEAALVELTDAVCAGEQDFHIFNIHHKDAAGDIVEMPMRPLTSVMDELPFPDYSVYRKISEIAADEYPMVYYERGCPYTCSYCHNSDQRALYKGLGKYVRRFSVDRIIAESKAALESYPKSRTLLLGADTFGAKKDFTRELLTRFKDEVGVPYTCLVRPELVTEELAKMMAETGCHMVAFGVESGSERIRTKILGRKYSNAKVVEAAKILREFGVSFRTYNIVGFPSESREEMLETLELNLKIRPEFPWASIYTPYPRTELADYCVEHGHLSPDFSFDDVPLSFFNDTILENVDRSFIRNIHAFFQLFVLMPFLYPVFKWLLYVPHNPVFGFIFKAVYSYVCVRSENRTIWGFLKLAFGNRHMFSRKVKSNSGVTALMDSQ
ncbi:MAG: B12-binding domain-containing radical SAM protein [Magnetovibrio sp.]|nr:B12-binding domain-containing radical SAM protein [Magnetovibrio sp.]